MPGAVPQTSSHALNNATLPFGLSLANKGLDAIRNNAGLMAGLNVHKGIVTNQAVAESLGIAFQDGQSVLG
jgi:alanine dehydrogenase